jgi:serine/threonine protein kinase
MIVFSCSHCGQKLRLADDSAGKKAKCPRCGQLAPVPRVPATTSGPVLTDSPPEPEEAAGGHEVETLAPGPVANAPTLSPSETATSATGKERVSIPGYEILSEIGRGGMGVIYKARQEKPRRLVALKMILSGEYASADQRTRFQREAAAVAKLQHPNIVRIHEVGEHQGRTFLTLEYVEGSNLAQHLKGKPLPPRRAAALLYDLARAVQHAHKQGIVHRDLKPANILLTLPEDENSPLGTPKIVDFGLAKQLDGMASVRPAGPSTQSGAILGTPGYMAPEQADGKGKKVGPAADVYALGAILYETLTGKPPFEAKTALDTIMKVLTEEPQPLRQVQPKVPRDLETICLKCLAKEPQRRYASAKALADDLRRFLEGEPILARPQGSLQRLGRWLKRRREYVYLAAGAVAALCVVLAIIFWPTSPEAQQTPSGSGSYAPLDPGTEESLFAIEARKTQSGNNLKQISTALHSLHDTYGEFPPPAICDKWGGKPLLSWRVAILPFIEEGPLYQQFKLEEPWDSPHNIKLLDKMPKAFQIKGLKKAEPYTTYYQAIVGNGAAWERLPGAGKMFGAPGLKMLSFTDGTTNTILVVEAAKPVPWTKPEEVDFIRGAMHAKLGGVFKDGFHALMADSQTLFVSKKVDETTLQAAITRAGGEVMPNNWWMDRAFFKEEARSPEDSVSSPEKDFPKEPKKVPDQGKGKESVRVKLSGKVTYLGKPLSGGTIEFLPDNPKEFVTKVLVGQINKDGTYKGGLAPGKYRITVASRPGEPIPERYQIAETSGLICEVREGEQSVTMNIDLKN